MRAIKLLIVREIADLINKMVCKTDHIIPLYVTICYNNVLTRIKDKVQGKYFFLSFHPICKVNFVPFVISM